MICFPVALSPSFRLHRWVIVVMTIVWGHPSLVAQQPTRTNSTEALYGEPLGVFTFDLKLPDSWDGQVPRILIRDATGRTLYPVVIPMISQVHAPQERLFPQQIGRPDGLIDRFRTSIRPLVVKEKTSGVQVLGRFQGEGPLSIEVYGDLHQRIDIPVQVQPDPGRFGKLVDIWWTKMQENASAMLADQLAHASLPHFLISSLSRRLNLPAAELPEPPPATSTQLFSIGESKPQFLELLESVFGTEDRKQQSIRRLLRGPLLTEALLPLPPEPLWLPSELPTDAKSLASDALVEEIAGRVPPECFYLRFGSYANYLWFQDLGKRFGGDLSNAISLPGLATDGMERAERMLATRTTTVSKMFGDKLVKDMGFFGSDLYFEDGPSMAVLIHAANPSLLKASLESDRKAILSENADASLSQVAVGDQVMSFISTPDNRIRSYLLVDGPFLLITTSFRLAERFIDVGKSQISLASTPQFQWVRSQMPEENQYSVFGYFSPEFFQRLLGPQYQIELWRRQMAVAHLELAEIASQAALFDPSFAETLFNDFTTLQPNQDLASNLKAMQECGLLPAWFDQRPDESRLLRRKAGWVDSLRGARGNFLPIADIEILSVSPDEAAEYAKTAEFYQTQWGRMDPLFFGLRRFQAENPERAESSRNGGQVEQVAIEAFLAPFEPKKYGWIFEQLASPSQETVQFPADDLLSVQMRLRGPSPDESYYLFGGLKDMLPPETEEVKGLLKSLKTLKSAPAYLGAWPKPDLISNLPLGIGSRLARPDPAGYSRMIGGLWRWQNDQWSLLSFHKNILDTASQQVGISSTSDTAQIRMALADLYGSQLAEWFDQMWWEQGWKSSRSNTAYLDTLHQQLGVPVLDCPQVAGQILGAQLQCALGGQYELRASMAGGTEAVYWSSTAPDAGTFAPGGKPRAPDHYSAPWIEWLRGAKIHVTQQPNSLSVVGLINVDLPPVPGAGASEDDAGQSTTGDILPIKDFNVFDVPLKLFGKKDKNGDKTKEVTPKRQSF